MILTCLLPRRTILILFLWIFSGTPFVCLCFTLCMSSMKEVFLIGERHKEMLRANECRLYLNSTSGISCSVPKSANIIKLFKRYAEIGT